jgi:ATP-dependent DNA ligase
MYTTETQTLISYPCRPINGGPLDNPLPKLGRWAYEAKYNGWRGMLHLDSGKMWNRHGSPLTIRDNFAVAIAKAKNTFKDYEWLDCEAMHMRHKKAKGTLVVLDIMKEGEYWERRAEMENHLPTMPIGEFKTNGLFCSHRSADGQGLYDELQGVDAEFYEGVVAKKIESIYPIQLENPNREFSQWVKHRWD